MRPEYDFTAAKRGPAIPTPGKTRITIRIDNDTLDWFRELAEAAGGGNYQTLINQMLREQMILKREPLEDTLRRVIREEMQRYEVSATGSAGSEVKGESG